MAAVALSHGLHVNLVRRRLVGRGLKRTDLTAPKAVSPVAPNKISSNVRAAQFVPVDLAPSRVDRDDADRRLAPPPLADADIQIELRRGGAQLTVRWPPSPAAACAT